MLPINVSHVCSLWRELALRTPALWRRIWLGSRYHMWRERIYRARSCSLDIVLWSPDPAQRSLHSTSTVNFFQVQSYMHIVSPYVRRWRSLDIRLRTYSPYLWNGALSECCSWSGQTQAPLLEELTLIYRQNDDTKEFCLFSGHAPRLHSATIDGIRLTWLPSLFQNLTFLDYTHHGFNSGYQAIQEIVTLLQVSSRLVHLRLMFPDKMFRGRRSSRSSPVIPQVHLPFLRTLHLRVETKDIPYEFIFLASLLITPVLTSLSLIDTTPQRSPFSNVRTFISLYIFPPSLQSVSIHYGWYTKELVTWLTQKLPSLKRLTLKRRDDYVQELELNQNRRRRV
ncbi:hypothetical protein K435DRAFT_116578 [Dendrothele bispora CBS 962.96]|uniref:Uncharacterized protein n=1 Tax=Dendrothele bispora (strain CBS 962.96) TaxID=1314807 RepID=A0A4S8MQM8_DENBC|nr:hypothetical protein K435DRAFT_116578 [Dendrothele bispora CBS 962.96]